MIVVVAALVALFVWLALRAVWFPKLDLSMLFIIAVLAVATHFVFTDPAKFASLLPSTAVLGCVMSAVVFVATFIIRFRAGFAYIPSVSTLVLVPVGMTITFTVFFLDPASILTLSAGSLALALCQTVVRVARKAFVRSASTGQPRTY